MNPIVNETMAVAVRLPDDACNTYIIDKPLFIVLVEEDGGLSSPVPFGYRQAWELILELCRDRASRATTGALRVNGHRIEPDAYVRRWRSAIANAVPLCQVRQELGLRIEASFSWPIAAAVRGLARTRTSAPYDTFGALLLTNAAAHPLAHRVLSDAGRELLQIDLAAPNGTRDAQWAGDWLQAVDGARASFSIERVVPTRPTTYPAAQTAREGAAA